ncbi:unnamed protein product, partial [marine sediment metagenome]
EEGEEAVTDISESEIAEEVKAEPVEINKAGTDSPTDLKKEEDTDSSEEEDENASESGESSIDETEENVNEVDNSIAEDKPEGEEKES